MIKIIDSDLITINVYIHLTQYELHQNLLCAVFIICCVLYSQGTDRVVLCDDKINHVESTPSYPLMWY